MKELPLAIVIVGPTAIGKTKVAIQIAKHFHTEIISADSRQFYQELKIGTAPPSLQELSSVPHHFIGNLHVEESYNISKFENDALTCAEKLFEKHKIIILVGGSGLYIDAFCKGIDVLPDPDPVLRKALHERLNQQGITSLQSELKALDPDYYSKVDSANPSRLIRALEVIKQSGQTYSFLRKQQVKTRPFQICKIGLIRPRMEMYEQINLRVELMMKEGLLDEVKELYQYKHCNSLNTVGYKELFAYLDGEMSIEEAIDKIKVHTRRYAKRQLTWFQRDKETTWFSPTEVAEIINYTKGFQKISD